MLAMDGGQTVNRAFRANVLSHDCTFTLSACSLCVMSFLFDPVLNCGYDHKVAEVSRSDS